MTLYYYFLLTAAYELRFDYNSSSEDTSFSELKFNEFSDEYPSSGICVLKLCRGSQAQVLIILSTTSFTGLFMLPIALKSDQLNHFRS